MEKYPHQTYQAFNPSEHERRLVFVEGKEIREQQQELSDPLALVERKLDQVTRLNEQKRALLYDDIHTRFMLEAAVDIQGGQRVRWMTDGLQSRAQEWHPAFKQAKENYKAMLDRVPEQVTALLDGLRGQLKTWKEAEKTYAEAFGTELDAALTQELNSAVAVLEANKASTKEDFLKTAQTPTLWKILDASPTFRALGVGETIESKLAEIKAELAFDAFDPEKILSAHIREHQALMEQATAICARMQAAFAETDAGRERTVKDLEARIAELQKQIDDPATPGSKKAELTRQKDALLQELVYAKLSKEEKLKSLKTEWQQTLSLSDGDRRKMEAAIAVLQQESGKVAQNEKVLLRGAAPERRLYLLKFGGYNAEWLLAQAQIAEGEYNPQVLQIDLAVLGFSPDLAELTRRSKNKAELIQYITQLEMEVEEGGVTRKVRFTENPAGISLSQMFLRSQFPPDVVESLQTNDLKASSAGLLFELSELDPTKTLGENLDRIVAMVTVEEGGKRIIDREKFLQTVTFLLFTKDGANDHLLQANEIDVAASRLEPVGKKSELEARLAAADKAILGTSATYAALGADAPITDADIAKIHAELDKTKPSFRAQAEVIFNKLLADGAIKKGPDNRYILMGGTLNAADQAINAGLDAEIGRLRAAVGQKKSDVALAGTALAEANAVAEYNALPPNGILTAGIIAQIINRLDGLKKQPPKPEEFFKTKFSAELPDWTADAQGLIKSMKDTGVDTAKLGTRVSMLWDESTATAKHAAEVWWAYIKSLPRLVYDPKLDPQVKEMLKKHDALAAASGSLVDATEAFREFDGAFAVAEKQLKADQASVEDALKPLEVTADPKRHFEGAQLYIDANADLIARLNREHDWQHRPLKIRQVSYWIATHMGDRGLELAGQFLRDAAAVERDPVRMEEFLQAYRESLPPAELKALQAFLDRYARAAEHSGKDVLAEARNRGIEVKRDALMVLSELELAGNLGRWHIDPPEEVQESLVEILYGAGAQPLIDAFVTKESQTYEFDGRQHTITAEDANLYVRQVQADLIYKSQQESAAEKQNKQFELFQDPLEKGLRGLAGTLGELWQGDWVDKGKAAAAIVAGIWIIHAAWKKGGFAKGLVVGLPLLMVANSVYKRQTGRDLLGEHLTYMSKDQRGTAVERFRRRGAEIDEYKILGTNAGHAAIQQLTSRDSPITVEELLEWRRQVKSKGNRDYAEGAPENLNITAIWTHMGGADMDEAYKVAFLAFESLCVDVASLNGISGDHQSQAEQGADFIQRYYVDFEEYKPDDPRRDLEGQPITMLDVIINEARKPATEDAVTEDRIFIEWLADSIGQSKDYVLQKLKTGYTYAQIYGEKFGHDAPEYWREGKEWVLDSYDKVKEWVRLRYHVIKPEAIENYEATWRFIYESATSIGMTIATEGPEAVKFIFKQGAGITGRTYEVLQAIHSRILANPYLNYALRPCEEAIMYVLAGREGLVTLSGQQAKEQAGVENHTLDTFVANGDYRIRDVSSEYTVSTFFPVKRTNAIGFEVPPATSHEVVMNMYRENLAEMLFGDGTKFADLEPSQQRMVLEVLKANMFRELAREPSFVDAERVFTVELDRKRAARELADETRLRTYNEFTSAENAEKALFAEFRLAFSAPLGELQAEHGKITARITEYRQAKIALIPQIHRLEGEIRTHVANAQTHDRNRETAKALAEKALAKKKEADVFLLKKKAEYLTQKITAELPNEAKYYVYVMLASAPNADEIRSDEGKLRIFIAAERTRRRGGTPPEMSSDPTTEELYLRYQYAADVASLMGRYQTAKTNATAARERYTNAEQAYTIADQEFTRFERDGLQPVKIKLDALFDDAVRPGAQALKADVLSVTGRETSLLQHVFNENRDLVGIPFDWLMGDARETARKEAERWVNYVVSKDQTYLEYMKADASTPEGREKHVIANAYVRYLEFIALNEIFQRALLKSVNYPADDERSHVLHLSVFEADRIFLYLKEKEGLVRFADFVKTREKLRPALRR